MEAYEVLRVLGRGAYGVAVLAQRKALRRGEERLRVIKEIDLSNMTLEARCEARREADVLRSLAHVNIVGFVESFLEVDKLCIVMEFADGGDLHDAVRQRRDLGGHFAEVEVMATFVQICLGLQHAHARHILHRDMKCRNIFVTKAGTVKIGDFGIAKILDHSTAKAKTCLGTPHYASPEVCDSRPYGLKADIWALGIVLNELLALEAPFRAHNLVALLVKILSGEPQPLPDWCSPEVRELVALLLQKDPEHRPTCEELLANRMMCVAAASLATQLPVRLAAGDSPRDAPSSPSLEQHQGLESTSLPSLPGSELTSTMLSPPTALQPRPADREAVPSELTDAIGELLGLLGDADALGQPALPEDGVASESAVEDRVPSVLGIFVGDGAQSLVGTSACGEELVEQTGLALAPCGPDMSQEIVAFKGKDTGKGRTSRCAERGLGQEAARAVEQVDGKRRTSRCADLDLGQEIAVAVVHAQREQKMQERMAHFQAMHWELNGRQQDYSFAGSEAHRWRPSAISAQCSIEIAFAPSCYLVLAPAHGRRESFRRRGCRRSAAALLTGEETSGLVFSPSGGAGLTEDAPSAILEDDPDPDRTVQPFGAEERVACKLSSPSSVSSGIPSEEIDLLTMPSRARRPPRGRSKEHPDTPPARGSVSAAPHKSFRAETISPKAQRRSMALGRNANVGGNSVGRSASHDQGIRRPLTADVPQLMAPLPPSPSESFLPAVSRIRSLQVRASPSELFLPAVSRVRSFHTPPREGTSPRWTTRASTAASAATGEPSCPFTAAAPTAVSSSEGRYAAAPTSAKASSGLALVSTVPAARAPCAPGLAVCKAVASAAFGRKPGTAPRHFPPPPRGPPARAASGTSAAAAAAPGAQVLRGQRGSSGAVRETWRGRSSSSPAPGLAAT